ncbi:hypothetical protein BBP40_008545 [Aspergillus hancockii]|nr:hypothetical protein BBP40_008545 [Aspergillus hancockii]
MPTSELNPDVWHLIINSFGTHKRENLYNLCLVSKEFHSIATPFLYHSIILGNFRPSKYSADHQQGETTSKNHSCSSLLVRLQDEASDELRSIVREITVIRVREPAYNGQAIQELSRDDVLATLVTCLPSLERVNLEMPMPLSCTLIQALSHHSRNPQLHLRVEDGTTTDFPTVLPCVSSIRAHIDPYDRYKYWIDPNTRIIALQKLFFACPNLQAFSVDVLCSGQHTNFIPNKEDIFPPVERLSLNGYTIADDDWVHWKERCRWEKLSSLTIGPHMEHRKILSALTGYAQHLRSLVIRWHSWHLEGPSAEIERYLLSFNSLEDLEVTGYKWVIRAVTNHPNLTRLWTHTQDYPASEEAEYLQDLEVYCPKLEALRFDMQGQRGRWSRGLVTALASRFINLRHLSLHFDLQWGDCSFPNKPTLNDTTAQQIGQLFFKARKAAFEKRSSPFPGRFQVLTLQTGELPPNVGWRMIYGAAFECRPSNSPPGHCNIVHVVNMNEDYGLRDLLLGGNSLVEEDIS